MKIVLGSSSPFRKSLLENLCLEFTCCSPNIDESQRSDETPEQLVERLSIAKAKEVAKQFPEALIISSDQVAVHSKTILGKPHVHENAVKQLTAFSGESVQFLTGLCLYNSQTQNIQYVQDITLVQFRQLNQSQINKYLYKEKPYQCAGSFRSEGLGAALFHSIESEDPNALIGLPIMKLVEILANEGVDILENL
ncbi:MAG: septum formation inhibitor Maf [Gammaproteobacteria bacterium]|nr:septum formation inhibitor Maf [Gammaproteobacteria bacterium]